ncbi:MAG: hypothetical protein J6A16_10075 [Oscillospiraceae bacterium]|nr:hypothetical protein [Oscillospiraceae bacterium]
MKECKDCKGCKERDGSWYKIICVVLGLMYVGYTILNVTGVISQELLSVVSMNAVCGLILNELALKFKKCPVLYFFNIAFAAFTVIIALVFTIQHFTSENFELFAVNGILLLPVIVSVIASAMNVFLDGKMLRKGSNSDE